MRDTVPKIQPGPDLQPCWTEAERLTALTGYDILGSEIEPAFDDITALVAKLCDVPIAVINFVTTDRQFFKSEVGLGVREIPLESSFCRHALRERERMIVPDARMDVRFADNPLVTPEDGLRFYAGVLLKTQDGLPIGTLCVLDTQPRPQGLSDLQWQGLDVLARQVMNLMALRASVKDERQARDRLQASQTELADSEARFRAIADSMPQMVWSTLPDGFHDYYNARWYEFTGVPAGSTDGEAWNGMFHPDDQERAWGVWRHSLDTGDLYEIEYRLRRHDGVYRWTLGRAAPIRDDAGQIVRWFGTCTDIDDLKRMEQGQAILSQELSHRIKNIFAVVTALISLSARQFPQSKAFAAVVRERIAALGQAHEFVRPHSDVSQPSVGDMTLHAFLDALFRPYGEADGQPRVIVSGDDAQFDDQAATSVALLFHEMATNAAKYGALSVPEGGVTLNTRKVEDRFVLTWTERGGPPVTGVPERTGFGSSLATVSVEGQLGGRLERRWEPDGLIVVADLPSTALSRRKAALKAA